MQQRLGGGYTCIYSAEGFDDAARRVYYRLFLALTGVGICAAPADRSALNSPRKSECALCLSIEISTCTCVCVCYGSEQVKIYTRGKCLRKRVFVQVSGCTRSARVYNGLDVGFVRREILNVQSYLEMKVLSALRLWERKFTRWRRREDIFPLS